MTGKAKASNYRDQQNVIRESDPRRIVYLLPELHNVPKLMLSSRLCCFRNEAQSMLVKWQLDQSESELYFLDFSAIRPWAMLAEQNQWSGVFGWTSPRHAMSAGQWSQTDWLSLRWLNIGDVLNPAYTSKHSLILTSDQQSCLLLLTEKWFSLVLSSIHQDGRSHDFSTQFFSIDTHLDSLHVA